MSGSKHAIDYLGSFDATETTSTTATATNANNNDPCGDIAGVACTPSAPADKIAITDPNLVNCNGSAGTPPATLATGFDTGRFVKIFGAGADLTAFGYDNQNVTSGSNNCYTFAHVTFTVPAGTDTVVIAWGGHISSQFDWGTGNTAVSINGSPYHMALDSIDTTTIGSQDRALATSAIILSPTIATQLSASTITVGSTVHDSATLSGASSTAGGTVDYRYYSSQAACEADTAGTGGTDVGTVTVTNGVVPDSAGVTLNTAGTYYFAAFYSGAANNNASKSDCSTEVLVVQKASPTISTGLSSGTIAVGSSVNDSATLHNATSDAGGTVTYRYYGTQAACEADTNGTGGTLVNTVTVTNGAVPNSSSVTFDTAGTYYFAAFYSGDSNNNPAKSDCSTEVLVVNALAPTIATQLSANPIPVGSSVNDSATLTGATPTAGGTVDYRYYSSQAACAADTTGTAGTDVGTVTVTNGVVPDSASVTLDTTGDYYFAAFYSGDHNNTAAKSDCATEHLVVNPLSPAIATQLSSGTIAVGSSVNDTATLAGATPTAGGTVDYRYYSSQAACEADTAGTAGTDVGTVPVANGVIPDSASVTFNSAGTYYFAAYYSGDTNNNPAKSDCSTEVLVVNALAPTIATQLSASTIERGTSVHDSATLSGATPDAGGTVDYRYYASQADCAADATGAAGTDVGTVTVANGAVPNSPSVTMNTSGTFYFAAFYSGDNNNLAAKSDCATEVLTVIHPAITIVKTASPTSGGPGDPVTYTYTVKNTGDTTLYGVVVVDDKLGTIGTIATLAPGQVVTLTKRTTLPSTAGLLTNVGIVAGHDILGTIVRAHDNATVTVVLPVILVKTGTNTKAAGLVGFLFIAIGMVMATRKERGRVRPAFAPSSSAASRAVMLAAHRRSWRMRRRRGPPMRARPWWRGSQGPPMRDGP